MTFTDNGSVKLTLHDSSQGKDIVIVDQVGFVFGCDGARYSAVRRQMDQCVGLSITQEYIEHDYKELSIPPLVNGEPALKVGYTHIWPRQDFMLIAFPNPDQSYTATLFMPTAIFDSIKTNEALIQFFHQYFPDALQKIGREKLVTEYFRNKPSRLMGIKCVPHYIKERALLMGDAAHAVLPFYGQGMNCGFEDCWLFAKFLQQEDGNLHKAASCYAESRPKDTNAIADLSKLNYIELRSKCTSTGFQIRQKIDWFLSWLLPHHFIPLYSMVSFSHIPYSLAVEKSRKQKKIVNQGLIIVLIAALMFGLAIMLWLVCIFY